MKSYRMHPWHNKIAAEVDVDERIKEIRADKPANQIDLRLRLIAIEVSPEQYAELDAVNAKWQLELDAIHTSLCDPNCPWDGKTIFTHRDTAGNWCMRNEGLPVAHTRQAV